MYINMHGDNIKDITCYIIAVHIMAQYMLINGDIETSILIYMVIMGDITMYMYISSISKNENFLFCFSLNIP